MRQRTCASNAHLCVVVAIALLGTHAGSTARTPTFVPKNPFTLGDPPCAVQTPGFTVEQEDDEQTLLDALTAGNPVPAGVQNLSLTISTGGAARVGVFTDFDLTDPMGSSSPMYSVTMPDGVVMTTGYLDQVPSGDLGQCNLYNDLQLSAGISAEDPDLKDLFLEDPQQGIESPDLFDGVSLTLQFSSDDSIGAVRFKVVMGSDEFPLLRGDPTYTQRQAAPSGHPVQLPGCVLRLPECRPRHLPEG